MNAFEFNKIAGAVLACILVLAGISNFANILVSPKPLKENVYKVEGVEESSAGGASEAQAAAEPAVPLAQLLAAASADAGKKASAKCASCHSFEKGGAAKVGPNLYDIVGANHARAAGFDYSAGLKAKASSPWSYEDLFEFINNPKAAISGTKMAFAGIKSAKERADLIAYLRSLSDSPKPLPN